MDNPTLNTNKKYPFWKLFFQIAGVLVGSQFALLIPLILLAIIIGETHFLEYEKIVTFGLYICAFSIAVYYGITLLRKYGYLGKVFDFSINRKDILLILWGILILFGISIVVEPILNLMPEYFEELMKKFINNGVLSIILAVICAPFFEELLFRGILQKGSIARYGAVKGIVLSGVLFGAIHFIPQQVIHASLAGMVMGYVYYKSGSLVPPIILHFVNNFAAVALPDHMRDISTQELINNNILYLLLYGICFVFVVVASIRIYRDIIRIEKTRSNKIIETTFNN